MIHLSSGSAFYAVLTAVFCCSLAALVVPSNLKIAAIKPKPIAWRQSICSARDCRATIMPRGGKWAARGRMLHYAPVRPAS